MKITKKITSIVLALLLAVSALAGLAITVNAADPTGTFTLDITKYDVKGDGSNYDVVTGTDSTLTGTTADAPSGKTPLAGVKFTMAKVADWNAAAPSLEDAAAIYLDEATPKIESAATDVNGHTTIQTTDPGIYCVVETTSPAAVTLRQAFLVSLPMTSADGQSLLNTVYVYPKNLTTLAGAKLTKTMNQAAYDNTNVKVAPVFKLYAGTDATGTLIATYTLATSTVPATAVKNTTDEKYTTVTVGVKDGVMAVDGLPTNDNDGATANYCWVEASGITLTDDTVLPVNSTPIPFQVVNNANSTIVTNASADNFGTFTYGNGTAAAHAATLDNSTTPTILKTVDKATAGMGETVTWTISPSVPADINTYKTYKVTDNVPSTLDIDSATVKLDGTEYTGVTPSIGNGYVTVDFAGKFAELKGKVLTIEIATHINERAVPNTDIENTASLEFKNSFDVTGTPSATAKTVTGGFSIIKKADSETGTAMADVEFLLQTADGKNVKVTPVAGGGVQPLAAYPTAGYYAADVSATDVTDEDATVKTNSDGKIFVKGLAQGTTYQLVEIKTNTGYQLLTDAKTVNITPTTYAEAGDYTIVNVKQPDLPLTGGMGTIIFTIVGVALIGGAAFLFIRSRKSKKEEA
ncbi:SpaH/EbpB family LPXTG-anchored major pilin [Ruminococcus sp. zg-924]|uniref:SpaH/EbpB family LPXTG-anchored major pilin n=1 Tax=Ruminococcus sp. zg-924 TaxID=2678505 RepID=UPI00210C0E71|nr:SpaH/EbpB family LPXTG-anchored major pilin [Ruminococcus sp. zg-924]MCQ4022019.1 SpaH/EbpB family LPXTG-anchored major pilin [Ruminococcus sp. zg-924]